MFRFIKTTAAGGLLFILPLVLIFILVEKAVRLLKPVLHKLLPMFDHYSVAGVTLFTVVALVALVLICFFAGLLAKTRAGTALLNSLEDNVLGKVPGYGLLKDATSHLAGLENVEGAKVGLVCEDEGWLFCLVLEQQHDWFSVYIPDAGPAGGSCGEVRMVTAAQVRLTGLSWMPVLACVRRGGHGALTLAAPWLPGADNVELKRSSENRTG
ncbi:hypothetical protein NYP20_14160 [Pseudomonas sp. N3-W]|uniref:DUF502 domain-containing protein n=1 Tax=Pseudomonas fungipugnans TaxID=3024217 RepID=A0ABT6QHF5_9PSED|nr:MULTISPECIES: hypothetical protein [unclassified Pseudomonas]MDI2590315.1 hypothetical protein [Pseudomonas sp. 681]UWF52036.1 hypothetical protein NYP20_14160 [Pseudomonas sp. N3-W]